MGSVLSLVQIAVRQALTRCQCPRVPEPEAVMDTVSQAEAYDRADESKLAVAYRAVLWFLDRLCLDVSGTVGVDVCCGPGHFTCALARRYPFGRVIGIDLSQEMLQRAKHRAGAVGLGQRVTFLRADARRLRDLFPPRSVRLLTCNNALHHFPDAASIRDLLFGFCQVVAPDGIILVSDLVRLKTPELNDAYVAALGQDYINRGLGQLLEDFRASMHAAWTPEELRAALPESESHTWQLFVPRWLPTIQIAVAFPQSADYGRATASCEQPPPFDVPVLEWQLMKLSLLMARRA